MRRYSFMSPAKTEHSKSLASKNLPYTIPNKSTTTPIEIPRRRRPITRNISSSFGQPTSPDLIFDMSPVSSEFPSPGRCAFSFSSSQELEQERFMYNFPMLATQIRSDRRAEPGSTENKCSPPISAPLVPKAKYRRSPLCQINSDDLLTSSTTTTKFMSTTKITGFAPPMQQPTPTSCSPARSHKTKRLSPPPYSSSYSSSPWILPGKSDILEEESASLDVDPSAFDFEKHLMQRIENQNQNPLRFRTWSLIS